MKRILWSLLLLSLFACNNRNNSTSQPFTPDLLALQLFSIDSRKDTSIKTLHGSIVKIVAGSFNVNGNIRLEIKEALSPAEILAAGLSTESNGRLLKSGGMIYVNGSSENGSPVELIKPIKISIPNSYYDSAMQLFKGVESDSGINWTEPQPLDTTDQSTTWLDGKLLFRSKCASCHSLFVDLTGPALKDMEYRGPWRDRKNIYSFIRNPARFMARDRYTHDLKRKFGSVMVAYPDISDKEMDALLAYINNESNRPGAAEDEISYRDSLSKATTALLDTTGPGSTNGYLAPGNFKKPCGEDTVYSPTPKYDESFFEEADTLELTTEIDTANLQTRTEAKDMEWLRGGFTDWKTSSGMYDFSISTFGWYNVDAYVEGYAGSTNVKLWVELQVDFDISMNVYLFCPRNKMLSVMNDKRDSKFFFNKINDGIPLFLKDRAILFAFGSKGDKMYYGIKEFRIQGEQTIQIIIKETNPEEIKRQLQSKKMEGIDLGIEKKEMKIISNPCDAQPAGEGEDAGSADFITQ